MSARRVEDLEAWQVANELKDEVYSLIKGGPASRDFEFRGQIRDSAASVTRNIAEGFGRFRPKDFARFMEYATASVMETQDSLKDGIDREERESSLQNDGEAARTTSAALISFAPGYGGRNSSPARP